MVDDLLTTACALWPGSEIVGERSAPEDGRPVRARYAVLPDIERPRLLVPLDPPGAASAALRRFSSWSTWRDSGIRLAAGAAARLVPGATLRHRVEIRGGEPGLVESLSTILGRSVTFSISIEGGPINGKPVLEIFDETGRSIAFAKLALSNGAAGDVRGEGTTLARLGDHGFHRLVAPSVLARGEWEDRPLLVTEPLHPGPWQRPTWEPPVAAMDEVASAFALPDGVLSDAPWWQARWDAAAALHDPAVRARLGRSLERVSRIAGARPIAWAAWHGDWTPWNMARQGRRVLVWNWERFEVGAPRGLDRIHYVVNALTDRLGATAQVMLSAMARSPQEPLQPSADDRLLGLLYLVAVTTRYVPLAERHGGDEIASRAAQSMLALEQLCAQ